MILCGPNGAGKSTIAKNIAHQAIIHGHTALITTAGDMLKDLASHDGDIALQRKLKYYTKPTILVIDEVGLAITLEDHYFVQLRRYGNDGDQADLR